MTLAHRWLLKWARLLHVYLTLFGFVLLLFFAVTGFMLNHEKWFIGTDAYERNDKGTMPMELLGENPDPLAIVEKLRKDFGARGEAVFDDNKENEEIRVTFKSPGYLGEATIKRDDGETSVNHRNDGVVSLLLDLHRGKDSGLAWSLVIDGVSVLFLIVSITGLILWSSLARPGPVHGMAVLLLGIS